MSNNAQIRRPGRGAPRRPGDGGPEVEAATSDQHDTGASLITHPLQHCPRCGSDRIEPVVEARMQAVHFLCQECGRCWDVGLGAVSRVPPTTCLGCPARGRCVDMYALDHPELSGTAG